jgi:uncharacterized protein YciW
MPRTASTARVTSTTIGFEKERLPYGLFRISIVERSPKGDLVSAIQAVQHSSIEADKRLAAIRQEARPLLKLPHDQRQEALMQLFSRTLKTPARAPMPADKGDSTFRVVEKLAKV